MLLTLQKNIKFLHCPLSRSCSCWLLHRSHSLFWARKDKKTKISLLFARHRHHSYCCSLLLALTLFAITTDVYRELMANLLQSAFCLKAILFFESFLVTAAWIFKRLNLDVFIVVSSSGYSVHILFVILLAMSI